MGGHRTRDRRRPDIRRERALAEAGVRPVAGIDEAGRGPLAGPVCAAAAVLDLARVPTGLDDSKRLAAPRREALFDEILATARATAIAFASPAEIDAVNIRSATHLAMRRALAALSIAPTYILVDGNDMPEGLACAGETIVGGDGTSASIAAASILAKIARDRLMRLADSAHPAYGFARHVGYPTRAHLAALATHGACPLHRRSFAPVARLLSPAPDREPEAAALSEKSTVRGGQP